MASTRRRVNDRHPTPRPTAAHLGGGRRGAPPPSTPGSTAGPLGDDTVTAYLAKLHHSRTRRSSPGALGPQFRHPSHAAGAPASSSTGEPARPSALARSPRATVGRAARRIREGAVPGAVRTVGAARGLAPGSLGQTRRGRVLAPASDQRAAARGGLHGRDRRGLRRRLEAPPRRLPETVRVLAGDWRTAGRARPRRDCGPRSRASPARWL